MTEHNPKIAFSDVIGLSKKTILGFNWDILDATHF